MFPVTNPSAIRLLASGDPERRAKALAIIVEAYWRPIYKYIRLRWNTPPAEAEDLTQAFFETAIDRETLAKYETGRARFRTFLRTCCERFVIDQHRMSSARRRGGSRLHVEFAAAEAELGEQREDLDPEAMFDAEWLRHLMQLALDRLAQRMTARGKPTHVAIFREVHLGDKPATYAETAARHGVSVTDVTNWLHVTRREFRKIALDLLRELTLDPEDFEQEARAVFGIDVRSE